MNKRIIILLIGLLLIVSGCSSQSNGIVDSFLEKSTEEFGTELFIPEYEEYPITSAEIIYPPTGDKKELTVVYSKEKGELMDENFIKNHEKNVGSKVLYGLYDGEPFLFRITYSNYELSDGNGDSETKIINGVAVNVREIMVKDEERLFTFFNVNEGSYSIDFALREGLNKEKAFEFVESIIKETNK
ncbi:hypothetical protein [Rossellomorea aquimaris]|uniref:hypothetical protein n=1 Tax=Rossellomorea aquimaris TaxID=189382 RepID=UPI0007D079F4|nr:hypothetical protein [Rossellomorea aquimaris]